MCQCTTVDMFHIPTVIILVTMLLNLLQYLISHLNVTAAELL